MNGGEINFRFLLHVTLFLLLFSWTLGGKNHLFGAWYSWVLRFSQIFQNSEKQWNSLKLIDFCACFYVESNAPGRTYVAHISGYIDSLQFFHFKNLNTLTSIYLFFCKTDLIVSDLWKWMLNLFTNSEKEQKQLSNCRIYFFWYYLLRFYYISVQKAILFNKVVMDYIISLTMRIKNLTICLLLRIILLMKFPQKSHFFTFFVPKLPCLGETFSRSKLKTKN